MQAAGTVQVVTAVAPRVVVGMAHPALRVSMEVVLGMEEEVMEGEAGVAEWRARLWISQTSLSMI